MPKLIDFAEQEMLQIQKSQQALRVMLELPEMEVEHVLILDGMISIKADGSFDRIVSDLEGIGWERKFDNPKVTRFEKDAISIMGRR